MLLLKETEPNVGDHFSLSPSRCSVPDTGVTRKDGRRLQEADSPHHPHLKASLTFCQGWAGGQKRRSPENTFFLANSEPVSRSRITLLFHAQSKSYKLCRQTTGTSTKQMLITPPKSPKCVLHLSTRICINNSMRMLHTVVDLNSYRLAFCKQRVYTTYQRSGQPMTKCLTYPAEAFKWARMRQ